MKPRICEDSKLGGFTVHCRIWNKIQKVKTNEIPDIMRCIWSDSDVFLAHDFPQCFEDETTL